MKPPTRRYGMAVGLFLAVLAAYAWGTAPTVLWHDSGELQTAALRGGIAHPSGYPLYIAVGWLWGAILPGDPAYRINLLSSVCGAATVALFFLILGELRLSRTAGVSGALVYGASFSLWWSSLRAEVYTFVLILLALAIWRWLICIRSGRLRDSFGAAFLIGAAMVSYIAFVFSLWPLLLSIIFARPLGARMVSRAAVSIIAAIIPVAASLAIIMAIDASPNPVNYIDQTVEIAGGQFGLGEEDFDTGLKRAFWLMSGGEHRDARPNTARWVIRNLVDGSAHLFLFEFGPLALIPFALGVGGVWRRRRLPDLILFMVFALALIAAALNAWGRMLPFHMQAGTLIAGVMIAMGLDRAYAVMLDRVQRRVAAGIVVAGMLALIGAPHMLRLRAYSEPIGPRSWMVMEEQPPRMAGLVPSLRGYRDAREYGEKVMENIPRNALVIGTWTRVTVLYYLHYVEGIRPDIGLDFYSPAHMPRYLAWQERHDVSECPFVVIGDARSVKAVLTEVDSLQVLGEVILIQRARITGNAMP